MPPLPTLQSDVIVLGEVSDASAFLSPDKTGVYSEYTVRVDQVFKTDDVTITPSQTINAEREGGRVRLSSGLIQSYKVLNQGTPRIGGKYVLFLKRVQGDLLILTGYELRQNKVKPLDKVNLFHVYKDVGLESFMDTLRQAMISPQPAPYVEYYVPIEPLDPPNSDPSGNCAPPTAGPCTSPSPIPGSNILKPNQEYTVTIDPTGFTPEKIDAIKRGFEKWNYLNGPDGTNNGIKFVGFTFSTELPSTFCNYCFHVRGQNDVRDEFGVKAAAKTAWQSAYNTYPYITTAVMTIDLSLPVARQSAIGCPSGQTWSYNDLEPTVEHEIGHPLGLADCYPECTGSSIMGTNEPRVQSPTPCDIQAVKLRYFPHTGGGGGGGHGGEGGSAPCEDHWGIWGVYNNEGDLIGYEWEYQGCF